MKEQASVLASLAAVSWSRGANFEKLNSGTSEQAIYSIRLSLKSRLLFTRMGQGEEAYWLLLDVLENHEYDKSHFLKKSYLKHYLKIRPVALTEPSAVMEQVTDDKAHLIELEYFNEQYIVLNSTQEKTLYTPMPLVVQGMPGSGKSCVALSMMRQCIDAPDARVLYVTKSVELIESMGRIWAETPGYDEAPVDFIAYEDLVPKSKKDTLLLGNELETFKLWLGAHPRMKQQLSEGIGRGVDLEALVYQEFRMMSGYELKEYQAFSQRQCLFAKERYVHLYEILSAYGHYLEQKHWIDLSLISFVGEARYTHVFVDEAQDFSTRQLIELSRLAKNNQIAYFIDNNQSLNDNFSKLPCLKRLFHKHLASIELPYTFRCSKAVINLANSVLGLKYHVTGGALDKDASTEIIPAPDAEEGSVIWTHQFSPLQKTKIEQSVRVAILCAAQDIKKASAEFPGALVLTVEQAKGLEYEIIVAYYLLERSIDKKLNTLTQNYQPHQGKINRPKAHEAHHEYGPALNQLFTAFSRARIAVYVLHHPKTHDIDFVLRALRNIAPQKSESPLNSLAQSSPEEISAEITRLIKAGKKDAAWTFYQSCIGKSLNGFNAIYETVYPRFRRDEEKKSATTVKLSKKECQVSDDAKKMKKAVSAKIMTEFKLALQKLSKSEDPAKVYLTMSLKISDNPQSLKDLINQYPEFAGLIEDFLNKGLFKCWSSSEQGAKLLRLLFCYHPHIAQGIKSETLYELTQDISLFDLLSCFYYWVSNFVAFIQKQ